MTRMKAENIWWWLKPGLGQGSISCAIKALEELGDDAPDLHFISAGLRPAECADPRRVERDPEIAEDVEMLLEALPPHWPDDIGHFRQ